MGNYSKMFTFIKNLFKPKLTTIATLTPEEGDEAGRAILKAISEGKLKPEYAVLAIALRGKKSE